jgi:hypothetical protein
MVGAKAAGERVVAGIACERVVTAIAKKRMSAGITLDGLGEFVAGQVKSARAALLVVPSRSIPAPIASV